MKNYDTTQPYPRDLVGYGRTPPHAQWPGQARVAVQFVLNFEEGGENSVLHGDAGSEQFLSEMFNPASYPDRHISMEGIYEFKELGHESACHGWRWIHYQNVDEATEREHMQKGMEAIQRLTGERPLGWYTGRDSPRTRRLVADDGGFAYDSDYYGDDLPFWMQVQKTDGSVAPQLIVPYTLDCNDMRFALPQGYSHADPFFQYLKDTFDTLYAEGDPGGLNQPAMMSIGMHCRLLGRPGRITALQRFLDHIAAHDKVWVCRRIDLARHWKATHPYQP
jgi:peptidoglycan/xylan/chitin deacetylase (PgdA/CDA1 family)